MSDLKATYCLFFPKVYCHVSAVDSLAVALTPNFCITYFGASQEL